MGKFIIPPELRVKLSDKGHQFKTNNSDTKVLLHLYEEKSLEMLEELNGMFAFALYDRPGKMLFCARDRMGIKPFYYACKNGKFAFSSELKSLLTLPWISRDVHFGSLYHYLSLQFVPAPNSIIAEVKKLPKGHYLVFDLERREALIKKYWDLSFLLDTKRDKWEWKELLKIKIQDAVHRWTLSDVPIACFLSKMG